MKTDKQILDSIKSISYKADNLFVCTVTDVDEVAHTCNASTLVGDSVVGISGIRLNAEKNDTMQIVPAVGSTIVVIMTKNKQYYMIAWSDIDKIIIQIDNTISLIGNASGWVFNDGNNGGVVKVASLVTAYNNVVTDLNTIKGALNGLGVPIVLTSSSKTAADFENTKVKH